MTYDRVHKLFLRAIAGAGVMTLVEAERYLGTLNDAAELSVQAIVKDINEEIRCLQQKIKMTNDELTNEAILVFMSLGYDEATKSQNMFSPNQLEYFRLLLEEIMVAELRKISGIHALNLVSKVKASFTKVDAEKFLSIMTSMKYLDKDEANNYALGVRTIHEFETYFRQNMPDIIEDCFLCKQIVFRGCNCVTCGTPIHTRCLHKYLEKIKKWPCCKVDFSPDHLLQRDNSRASESLTQQTQVDDGSTEALSQMSLTQEGTQLIIPEISQRVTRKRKNT